MEKLPVVKYGFTTYSKDDAVKLLSANLFDVQSATESDDIDIKIDEQSFSNSFLIIKASKRS